MTERPSGVAAAGAAQGSNGKISGKRLNLLAISADILYIERVTATALATRNKEKTMIRIQETRRDTSTERCPAVVRPEAQPQAIT